MRMYTAPGPDPNRLDIRKEVPDSEAAELTAIYRRYKEALLADNWHLVTEKDTPNGFQACYVNILSEGFIVEVGVK